MPSRRPPLPTMLDWAEAEGWNPGLDDAGAYWATDSEGFFLKELDDQPIACISVVNHSRDYAFLGFYICVPQYRGQGHGLALWNHAIEHAGDRVMGLEGVPDQQSNYEKSGFVAAHQTIRYAGNLPELDLGASDCTSERLAPMHRKIIYKWDQEQFGADRSTFLAVWFDGGLNRQTRVVLRDGAITGYGTIRPCVEGYRIGPFTAETEPDALALFAALGEATGEPQPLVMIDVPDVVPELTKLVQSFGLEQNFECARMYRGGPPEKNYAKFTAVATLELG